MIQGVWVRSEIPGRVVRARVDGRCARRSWRKEGHAAEVSRGLAFQEGCWKRLMLQEGHYEPLDKGTIISKHQTEYLVIQQAAVRQNMVADFGIAHRQTRVC